MSAITVQVVSDVMPCDVMSALSVVTIDRHSSHSSWLIFKYQRPEQKILLIDVVKALAIRPLNWPKGELKNYLSVNSVECEEILRFDCNLK